MKSEQIDFHKVIYVSYKGKPPPAKKKNNNNNKINLEKKYRENKNQKYNRTTIETVVKPIVQEHTYIVAHFHGLA